MAKHPQEDLFEGTTMTFGDHLEELRGSLTRALIGMTIGSIIGLIFANFVVGVIQGPLISALEKHYAELAVDKLKAMYPGAELDPQMVNFAESAAFVFEEVYLERDLLARLVDKSAPTDVGNGQEPKSVPTTPATVPATPNTTEAPAKSAAPATPATTTTSEEVAKQQAAKQQAAKQQAAAHDVKNLAQMQALLKEKLPSPQPDMIKIRMWRPAKARLTTLSPAESFMIWVKAGLVAGLLLASPYIFYQIWIFVAAGLYPHEKRYVHLYLPFSLILFLSGAALAFFFVFGPVLSFLFSFSRMLNIEPDLRISEVISFVLFLPLGFGIAFQLPLVMLFVHRIGLISIATYIEKWRIAILLIFVVAMLLTPSDPYSMLLMAVPLTFLYFLGLALCKWMPRGKNPFSEAYDP